MISDSNDIPNRFLNRLHTILSVEHHKKTISWVDDGLSFCIYDKNIFEQEILPIHYKHSNYRSFLRQLNYYKFCRFKHPDGTEEFNHNHFTKHNTQIIKKYTFCKKYWETTEDLQSTSIELRKQLELISANQKLMVDQTQKLSKQLLIMSKQILKQRKLYAMISVRTQKQGMKLGKFVKLFTSGTSSDSYRQYLSSQFNSAFEMTREAYQETQISLQPTQNLTGTPWRFVLYSPMPFYIQLQSNSTKLHRNKSRVLEILNDQNQESDKYNNQNRQQ